MNSLASQIDHFDICAEIRMERQKHKGSFLLVEGGNDWKRFGKFLSKDECSVVVCHGRSNVEKSVALLHDRGALGNLGLIDQDFDKVLKKATPVDDVITSNFHDFDIDMFLTPAFERYLLEVARPNIFDNEKTVDDLRSEIMGFIRPVSALRLVNQYFNLRYDLKNLDIKDFLVDEVVDIDRMILSVSTGKFSGEKEIADLKKRVVSCLNSKVDLRDFSNGHDVFAAISLFLENKIGSRRGTGNHPREIERVMRLTFDDGDMEESGLANKIRVWERDNNFQVLK